MKSIDLNADLGEGFNNDSEILKFVSSANIACGMHAGSPALMSETVRLAMSNNVSIGAHPGYPDREGFGRKEIRMSYADLVSHILYQVGALSAIAKAEGGKLSHIKAHGALYNSASKNSDIARAIIDSAKQIDPNLVVYGLPGSEIERWSLKAGMQFAAEVFADRGYNSDGSLVNRSEKGAIIEDSKECVDRTLKMVKSGVVESVSGEIVNIVARTICLHGDNIQAVQFASNLYEALQKEKIIIKPVGV